VANDFPAAVLFRSSFCARQAFEQVCDAAADDAARFATRKDGIFDGLKFRSHTGAFPLPAKTSGRGVIRPGAGRKGQRRELRSL
jgi:hypothetical protein